MLEDHERFHVKIKFSCIRFFICMHVKKYFLFLLLMTINELEKDPLITQLTMPVIMMFVREGDLV